MIIPKEAQMSELKTRYITDTYLDYFKSGKHDLAQIYLKSEADKVIAELEKKYFNDLQDAEDSFKSILELNRKVIRYNKYKRCLDKAKLCHWKAGVFIYKKEKSDFYYRWYERWLKTAEKFKEEN